MRLWNAMIFAVVRVLSEDDNFDRVRRRQMQRAKHIVRINDLAVVCAFAIDKMAQRRVMRAFAKGGQNPAPASGYAVELSTELWFSVLHCGTMLHHVLECLLARNGHVR